MDTGEIYVKMCERAIEIHKKILDYGDFFWWPDPEGKKHKDQLFVSFEEPEELPEKAIWLRRQDQLQDIAFAKLKFDSVWAILNILYISSKHNPILYNQDFTFERLWLTFVMREVYLKKWDARKEDWIAI